LVEISICWASSLPLAPAKPGGRVGLESITHAITPPPAATSIPAIKSVFLDICATNLPFQPRQFKADEFYFPMLRQVNKTAVARRSAPELILITWKVSAPLTAAFDQPYCLTWYSSENCLRFRRYSLSVAHSHRAYLRAFRSVRQTRSPG
jgi:hypothetical protein